MSTKTIHLTGPVEVTIYNSSKEYLCSYFLNVIENPDDPLNFSNLGFIKEELDHYPDGYMAKVVCYKAQVDLGKYVLDQTRKFLIFSY